MGGIVLLTTLKFLALSFLLKTVFLLLKILVFYRKYRHLVLFRLICGYQNFRNFFFQTKNIPDDYKIPYRIIGNLLQSIRLDCVFVYFLSIWYFYVSDGYDTVLSFDRNIRMFWSLPDALQYIKHRFGVL